MNEEENIPVITDREELYDKCENMEQLFDKYYLALLDKHYRKTYKLQQENQSLKDRIEKAIEWVYMIQQNKDNKHLEPVICTDELDELLEILKGDK